MKNTFTLGLIVQVKTSAVDGHVRRVVVRTNGKELERGEDDCDRKYSQGDVQNLNEEYSTYISRVDTPSSSVLLSSTQPTYPRYGLVDPLLSGRLGNCMYKPVSKYCHSPFTSTHIHS